MAPLHDTCSVRKSIHFNYLVLKSFDNSNYSWDDPSMTAAIEVEGLAKRFGDVNALERVDFEVPPGTVFGLLGPNGAGKTTTVRLLATILLPDGRTSWGGTSSSAPARCAR